MFSIKKLKLKHLLVGLLLLVVATLIVDLVRISGYETIAMNPPKKYSNAQNTIYWELVQGMEVMDWDRLDPTLEFIASEYDCADFRLVNLLRILYEYESEVPVSYRQKINRVLFGFRYWWDLPGQNSMCYWTENHQILFASAEYLVGQKYPDEIFDSGLTGRQHMDRARVRVLDWLEMRWNYGFTEYYSSVYYKEDIGALINLIDFAHDEEVVTKSKIVMDLLFYDIAAQSIGTMFISTSGRAYARNRTGSSGSRFSGIPNYYWGDGTPIKPGIMYGLMVTKNYQVPPVLKAIAQDTASVVIKQRNGLNITDLKSEGYYGTDNRSMMMQWGMQAFSNPEVVRNSLYTVRHHLTFANASVAPMKMLDITLFNWLHLEPAIIRLINPPSNGVAIQQGNTYTYKTKDYTMYTSQAYHPGTYSYQQHVFGANIGNHFAVFHMHPARRESKKNQSPGYDIGYGRLPHVVQHRNVSLALYHTPEEKNLMEPELIDFTRAYFPTAQFDTAFIQSNYAFGQKGQTYCAFIGANDFYLAPGATDDLIQPGRQTFWITEVSAQSEEGSFLAFVDRIVSNSVHFSPESMELAYTSAENDYRLQYLRDLSINGTPVNTTYSRFDAPYIYAEPKAKSLTFKHNLHSLHLNFEELVRDVQ
ncbi:hypothetical protein [Marinoscillum furvescens]|uniref:Heparinase II/III-like protein n=1 Tax=Marinoscillum furvescens DSM 4134 TaxID=1122208 RepID=A0A3D9KYU0_MARFU|nr:hypothetical protein [Marinoscillum furvescens]RED94635.1 hypothetical protein C7460_12030 [Marinoscillum furvescens DSM 4134]